MFIRISRLRLILIRCGFVIISVFILWQIRTFLRENRNSVDIFYWQELPHGKKFLSKEQRLVQIEFLEKHRRQNQLNWTQIFHEIYARKLQQIQQRDQKTSDKIIRHIPTQNSSQKIFQIFEETPVRTSVNFIFK